jgi:hypothetical protein
MSMDRAEYLEWCKQRARDYLKIGDDAQAVASMLSDMGQRDDCKVDPILAQLGIIALINRDHAAVARFIEGFR